MEASTARQASRTTTRSVDTSGLSEPEYSWSIRPEGDLPGATLGVERIAPTEFERIFRKLEAISIESVRPVPTEVRELLAMVADPGARIFLIEALRLAEPKVFTKDAVRVACFQALKSYAAEPDVIQLCAEEFQTHKDNEPTVQAASAVLEEVKLSAYPAALAILNTTLDELRQSPAKKLSSLSVGAQQALKLLLAHDPNILSSTIIGQTLTTYASGADCSGLIDILGKVGTEQGKQLLYGMATKRVFDKVDWRLSGYDRADTMLAFTFFGVNIVGDLAAIIGFRANYGFPGFMMGLMAGVGVFLASALTVGSLVNQFEKGLLKEDVNVTMSERALLALGSYLPDDKIEKLYIAQSGNEKLSPAIRTELTRALVTAGSQESLKGYLENLSSGNSQAKIETIKLLADRKESWIVSAITKATSDTDPEVRAEATRVVRHWRG